MFLEKNYQNEEFFTRPYSDYEVREVDGQEYLYKRCGLEDPEAGYVPAEERTRSVTNSDYPVIYTEKVTIEELLMKISKLTDMVDNSLAVFGLSEEADEPAQSEAPADGDEPGASGAPEDEGEDGGGG